MYILRKISCFFFPILLFFSLCLVIFFSQHSPFSFKNTILYLCTAMRKKIYFHRISHKRDDHKQIQSSTKATLLNHMVTNESAVAQITLSPLWHILYENFRCFIFAFFSMKISLQRYFKAAGIKTNKEKNYLNEIFLQYKMQLSTRKE